MKDISDKRVNISLDNPSITFDKNKCDDTIIVIYIENGDLSSK